MSVNWLPNLEMLSILEDFRGRKLLILPDFLPTTGLQDVKNTNTLVKQLSTRLAGRVRRFEVGTSSSSEAIAGCEIRTQDQPQGLIVRTVRPDESRKVMLAFPRLSTLSISFGFPSGSESVTSDAPSTSRPANKRRATISRAGIRDR